MTVTIRLTKNEEARLNALADRTGRTKSFYVRTAVREYLKDLEDAFAADEAMRQFNAGGRKTIPLDELIADLGITEKELHQATENPRKSGELRPARP